MSTRGPQTWPGWGDLAATLVDDSKRSITRGRATGGSGLLGGRAGTDSPWELDLGVWRPGDEITVVVFVFVFF